MYNSASASASASAVVLNIKTTSNYAKDTYKATSFCAKKHLKGDTFQMEKAPFEIEKRLFQRLFFLH